MSTHSPHHLTRTPASSLVFFQVPDSEDELLRMVPLPLHNFESPPSRPSSIFYLLTSWHSATLRQITERAEIGPNYLSKKKLCQRIYIYIYGIPKMEDFAHSTETAPKSCLPRHIVMFTFARTPDRAKSTAFYTSQCDKRDIRFYQSILELAIKK